MRDVFERVVCGVDSSEAGVIAARLAARVAEPEGELALVSINDLQGPVRIGSARGAPPEAGAGARALARASSLVPSARRVETALVEGRAIDALLAEVRRRDATLVVVGAHDRTRAVGIALGSVMTHVLHDAACSVLVAREPRSEHWPRSIVVGVDGSPESVTAAKVARELAERVGASVRFVAATQDAHVDRENGRMFVPELEELPGRGVDELHVLSDLVDLVVVGSRGLRGIRALGSVSECVAHEARTSVLVVRT